MLLALDEGEGVETVYNNNNNKQKFQSPKQIL